MSSAELNSTEPELANLTKFLLRETGSLTDSDLFTSYQISGPHRYAPKYFDKIRYFLAIIPSIGDATMLGMETGSELNNKDTPTFNNITPAEELYRAVNYETLKNILDIGRYARTISALEVLKAPNYSDVTMFLYVSKAFDDIIESRRPRNMTLDSAKRLFGSWALYNAFNK